MTLHSPSVKLGLLADVISGSGFPDKYQGNTGHELPFYKVSSLSGIIDGAVGDAEHSVSRDIASNLGARIIPTGSVIMAKIGAALMLARYAQTSSTCCIDNNMQALVPREDVDSRFLLYAMTQVPLRALVKDGPVPTVDVMGMKMTRLPLHDLVTQQRIADYLDRETGEIDTMIAKMDELADVLRARLERTIEHAIFESRAPLGALGYVIDCLPGYAFPSSGFSTNPSDLALLRGINVKTSGLDWSDTVYWPTDQVAALAKYKVQPGDLVLGMDRPFVRSGTRVLMIQDSDRDALLVQRVLRVRPLTSTDARFIYYILRSKTFETYATPETTGISVPHISEGQVSSFRLPLPDATEQKRIADYLDEVTSRIDTMLARVAELKALLTERRAALITDVVTGRKDAA